MISSAQHNLTAEEFWRLPGDPMRRDLVHGEVIVTLPPDPLHGNVTCDIGVALLEWARQSGSGCIGVRSGHILGRNPDTVRGPDVSYVRADRIPSEGVSEAFWTIAPDLAVEVISSSETIEEVRAKIRDFLAAGTPLVWTIDPTSREVVVYTPDGMARTYGLEDVIEYPDVLPGFTCKVAELFA